MQILAITATLVVCFFIAILVWLSLTSNLSLLEPFSGSVRTVRAIFTERKADIRTARKKVDTDVGVLFGGLICAVLLLALLGADLSVISTTSARIIPGLEESIITVPDDSAVSLVNSLKKELLLGLAFVSSAVLGGHLVYIGLGGVSAYHSDNQSNVMTPSRRFIYLAIGICFLVFVIIAQQRCMPVALMEQIAADDTTTTGALVAANPEKLEAARAIVTVTTVGCALLGISADVMLEAAGYITRVVANFIIAIIESALGALEAGCDVLIAVIGVPERLRLRKQHVLRVQRDQQPFMDAQDAWKQRRPQDIVEGMWCLDQLQQSTPHHDDYGLIRLRLDCLDRFAESKDPEAEVYRRALSYFSTDELRPLRGELLDALTTNNTGKLKNLIEAVARSVNTQHTKKSYMRNEQLRKLLPAMKQQLLDDLCNPGLIRDDEYEQIAVSLQSIDRKVRQYTHITSACPDFLIKPGDLPADLAYVRRTQKENNREPYWTRTIWFCSNLNYVIRIVKTAHDPANDATLRRVFADIKPVMFYVGTEAATQGYSLRLKNVKQQLEEMDQSLVQLLFADTSLGKVLEMSGGAYQQLIQTLAITAAGGGE